MSATSFPDSASLTRLRLVQPAGWVRMFLGASVAGISAILFHLSTSDAHSSSSLEQNAVTVVAVLIGLIVAMYRRVVVLDRSRGVLEVRRWCGVTWARTVRGLPAYDRVELRRRFEGRRSESWDGFTYPVFLAGAGGDLELVFDTSELRSRHRARAAARLTGRDLVDLTEEPQVRVSAEDLRVGPLARWRASGQDRSDLPAPDPGRVAAGGPGEPLRLRIVRERAPIEGILVLIGTLAGAGFLLYAAQELPRQSGASAGELVAMLVLAALGMAVLATGVRAWASRVAVHEVAEVTLNHLVIRLDAFPVGRVRIPLGEIETLEPRRSGIVITSDRAIQRLGEALEPGERDWVVLQLRRAIVKARSGSTAEAQRDRG